MRKIDTGDWKEFRVGDLFSQERGKEKAPKQNKDGQCPLIQEMNCNNGLDRYVVPTKVLKGNAITISINYASNVFYQEDDFCASVNIAVIRNSNLNKYNGQFIASVLSSMHRKYNYTNKISKEKIDNEIIKLPAKLMIVPDWRTFVHGGGTEMNKIDISSWKEFKISDLFEFEKIVGDLQAQKQSEGDIPLVSSGSMNNGICATIADPSESSKLINGNKITVDMFGKAFYQKDDFYAVAHARVNVLKPKFNMDENVGLYLATAIESKTISKYSFKEMCSQTALKEETILLPIKEKYEPDWQYMEEYMRKIESKVSSKLSRLEYANTVQKKNIATEPWGEFKLRDLFTIVPAKGKNSQQLNDGTDLPYIAASKENNGFNKMVSKAGFEDWISKGNCIQLIHIGDAAAGCANYQPNDFIAMAGKSSCAYNDKLNQYTGTFIASVIRKANAGKYSFSESWTGAKVLDTVISLPVKDGEPDWDYMEKYMRKVHEGGAFVLRTLTSALQ